jgi:hypothetical protein
MTSVTSAEKEESVGVKFKPPVLREFNTGAVRDNDEGKLDFEGFLSPEVLTGFAEYMHRHRTLADGSVRDSDNWQKGIPTSAYMKSMLRHCMTVWKLYRKKRLPEAMPELYAILFNTQGLLLNLLNPKPDPDAENLL